MEQVIEYALALGQHFERLPRASSGATLNRPDKPDLAPFIWVDSMHTDGPFLARLGQTTADPRWADLAAQVVLGQIASLQDPESGLFSHAYSDATRSTNGIHWSRGCGWAALGLAETLRWLPRGHDGSSAITAALRHLATGLRDRQTADGHWHVVADLADTPTEASALYGATTSREC